MVLKSRKHVFWEALVMTILVFLVGLFLGMLLETSNSEKIGQLYLESEIGLVDGLAVTFLAEEGKVDCETFKEESIDFANRVYEEAKLLEKYEQRNQLTDTTQTLHTKYDLLRGLLWMSNQDNLEKCQNYDLIVYLYQYQIDDKNIKATQNVWSKVLTDLREEREDLMLLPIAGNQNLTTITLLMDNYGVESLPAVVVNNDQVIYDLEELAGLKDEL